MEEHGLKFIKAVIDNNLDVLIVDQWDKDDGRVPMDDF